MKVALRYAREFSTWLKLLCASSLAGLLSLPIGALAADSYRVPISVPWDIRPANSRIVFDVVITECRTYDIYVDFNRGGAFDIKELRKFTGDSATRVVTAKQHSPVMPVPNTTAEVRRQNELIRQGVYELILVNLGVVMPVHLRLEELDGKKMSSVLKDETIDTDRENFGLDRAVTAVPLRVGRYRVNLSTLQETKLPEGVESSLVIAYRPKTRVLKGDVCQ